MTDTENRSRIIRLMAAAYDSPGATVCDGSLSLRVSKAKISPAVVKMLRERTKGNPHD